MGEPGALGSPGNPKYSFPVPLDHRHYRRSHKPTAYVPPKQTAIRGTHRVTPTHMREISMCTTSPWSIPKLIPL